MSKLNSHQTERIADWLETKYNHPVVIDQFNVKKTMTQKDIALANSIIDDLRMALNAAHENQFDKHYYDDGTIH